MGDRDVKGDGVEFGRFLFHLFVVMKSYAALSHKGGHRAGVHGRCKGVDLKKLSYLT